MDHQLSASQRARVDEVYRVLLAIRRALDMPYTKTADQSQFLAYRDMMNNFDSLRLTLRAVTRRHERESGYQPYLLSEAKNLISEVLMSEAFKRFFDRRYRRFPESNSQQNQISLELEVEEESIGRALERCHKALSGVELQGQVSELTDHSGIIDAARLHRIIPDQKIAPSQFAIVNERLEILPQVADPLAGAGDLAAAAREEIIKDALDIQNDLELSNCHPKILKRFETLKEYICTNADIVRVGIAALTCKSMISQFGSEIPDGTLAVMRSHFQAVDMYLGQFSEWQEFCANALVVEIDNNSLEVLERATNAVAKVLQEHEILSDPQVPKTLLYIREALLEPRQSAKRVGYAAVSTLENLISCIFNYTVDFLDGLTRKAIKTAAYSVGGVVGLGAVGLLGAELIAPVVGQVPTSQWILEMLNIIKGS